MFLVILVLLLVFSALVASAAKVSPSQLNSWLKKAKLDKYTPAKTDYDALYAAAKLEKKVIIYSVSSRIPEVKKSFEAQYPGVAVVWTFELNIIGSNGWRREDILALLDLIKAGKLTPALHPRRFSIAEAGDAMALLDDRGVIGKVIVEP